MELVNFYIGDLEFEAKVSFAEDDIVTYLFNPLFILQEIKHDKPMKNHPYTPEFEKELFALIADYAWEKIKDHSCCFDCYGAKAELYIVDNNNIWQTEHCAVLERIDKQNYRNVWLAIVNEFPNAQLMEGYINCIVKNEDLMEMLRNQDKTKLLSCGSNDYELRKITISWK